MLLILMLACGGTATVEPPVSVARAHIISARAHGDPGAYVFEVKIDSDDTGCDQFANWWELVRPDQTLVYRRILRHSHVDEQPFKRSGGPVALSPDEVVVVRAHMHPGGYLGAALRGSVTTGFRPVTDLAPDFAVGLATADPLPTRCLY